MIIRANQCQLPTILLYQKVSNLRLFRFLELVIGLLKFQLVLLLNCVNYFFSFFGTVVAKHAIERNDLDSSIRMGLRAAVLSLENEAAVPNTINPQFFASEPCRNWCKQIKSRKIE